MPDETMSFQSPVDRRSLRRIGATALVALMLLTGYSLLANSVAGGPDDHTIAWGSVDNGSLTAPGNAALSDAPDFSGTITASTTRAITIETQTGPRVVRIDADTKVFIQDGTAGTLDDLTRDTAVAIVATTADGGRTYRATEIAILPR
jgi:hypothetical protein